MIRLETIDLGLVPYAEAAAMQKQRRLAIEERKAISAVFLCEHPPVITFGRSAKPQHILTPEKTLRDSGITVIPSDRGGDVTFHGPGQLVIYPVIDLSRIRKDIHYFLRLLEGAAIDFFDTYDISARRKPACTGVWVGADKIASIGIAVKHWITYHGLAININTDLDYFHHIKPCGLDARMTSIQKILNKTIDMQKSKTIIIDKLTNLLVQPHKESRIHETCDLT